MLIYQIYPRSFKDSNADGVGDLRGILEKLSYIVRLGVDAIWISPFVKSPQKDFGYDVSDYCDVDPRFGTLNDFKKLLAEAHKNKLKVLMDQVWCHCSDAHPWFVESCSSLKNPKADWFIWADAKPDGTPPNNWLSYFGGGAWAWDTTRQQYYFHQFLESQPTFNLRNPALRKMIMSIGKFWLEMGVDGFRLDAIHTGFADPKLRNNPARPKNMPVAPDVPKDIPQARQIRLHSEGHAETLPFLEELRKLANRYGAVLLGEVGGENPLARAALYTQRHRLHMSYTFGLLKNVPDATSFAKTVALAEETKPSDTEFCYALSNHDVMRVASRWGSGHASRVAVMFGLSLPGSYCMYQGEELGLPEADVPYEKMVDPFGLAFYPKFKGRDGCRTPMPWNGYASGAGFSTSRSTWLPISETHKMLAVDIQERSKESHLHFTRRAIAWRKTQPALQGHGFKPIKTKGSMIAFERFDKKQRLHFVFNLGSSSANYKVPPHAEMVYEASIGALHQKNSLVLKPMSCAVLAIKPSKKAQKSR
ncbi:MAG: alpha-amylase family glycosyl hydrolase [Alphaproteobacteria bacterium]|nr:alpha-amylase family glycosyl hydrolase [Alphaproteobacteria bacterium]